MFISLLKRIFSLMLLVFITAGIKAQQVHFIYLQTDNGLPFYAKLNNNKVMSSSAEGYIILPGMVDGDYQLVIGFPKKQYPEETFSINISNDNKGFLLKNFDDKGWQLFNLQTLALTKGSSVSTAVAAVQKDTDPFSQMLANVVKDSTILQNHQVVLPGPVASPDTVSKKEAETAIAVTVPVNPPAATEAETTALPPHEDAAALSKPPVVKIFSIRDKEGLQMVYQDKVGSSVDTIRVFIPLANDNLSASDSGVGTAFLGGTISSSVDTSRLTITPTREEPPEGDTSKYISRDVAGQQAPTRNADSLSVGSMATEVVGVAEQPNQFKREDSLKSTAVKTNMSPETTPQKEQPTLNSRADTSGEFISEIRITDSAEGKNGTIEKENNGDEKGTRMVVLPSVVTSSKVNSDCKDFATNEDFLKLRRKMAQESDMDEMLKVALKYFRTKCFSTEQVKDLSYLFLTNEGKYRFFDEAYAFTSDSDRYSILQSQLTDKYYLGRFKAMIHR